jgi:membrane-associated phospholipid phosphatase
VAAAVAALEVRRHEGLRTRRPWAILALTTAGTTAVLRVAARKHYVTDIVAGAAVGWAAGRFVPKWLEREPRRQATQARLAPVVVPVVSRISDAGTRLGVGPLSGGGGSGVGLSLSWR